MAGQFGCPNPSQLRGLLVEEKCDEGWLISHLAQCAICRKTLELLATGSMGWLSCGQGEPVDRPPLLLAMMDSLKALTLIDSHGERTLNG